MICFVYLCPSVTLTVSDADGNRHCRLTSRGPRATVSSICTQRCTSHQSSCGSFSKLIHRRRSTHVHQHCGCELHRADWPIPSFASSWSQKGGKTYETDLLMSLEDFRFFGSDFDILRCSMLCVWNLLCHFYICIRNIVMVLGLSFLVSRDFQMIRKEILWNRKGHLL